MRRGGVSTPLSHELALWPDEAASEEIVGWVSREAFPDRDEAAEYARREFDVTSRLSLTPVLLREESEVEARIHGHEFPHWVQCTPRARAYAHYWRVEMVG